MLLPPLGRRKLDLPGGRAAEAEKLFQEVIAAQPEHANAQYEYGKILMDHGEVENAIAHLEMAARLNPQADYVHYQLQAAYRKDGRTADADRDSTSTRRSKPPAEEEPAAISAHISMSKS